MVLTWVESDVVISRGICLLKWISIRRHNPTLYTSEKIAKAKEYNGLSIVR